MARRDPVIVILVALLFLGYPLSYSALRVSHVLTHSALFVSAEGLDAHTVHGMEGDARLQTLYAPLIALELALHRHHQP